MRTTLTITILALLTACGTHPADTPQLADSATVDVGTPRSGLVLEVSDSPRWGAPLRYIASGAAPETAVKFVLSKTAEGEDIGLCPDVLEGECLDIALPYTVLETVVADETGVAEMTRLLPDLCLPETTAYVQAVSLGDGPELSNVTIDLVEGVPVGGDDRYVAAEDAVLDIPVEDGVLQNDDDCGGEGPLTAVLSLAPDNGTLSLAHDGSFVYTPDPEFNGSDRFRYTAVDDGGRSAPISVEIEVNPTLDPPEAMPEAFEVEPMDELVVAAPGVLANDYDVDGDELIAVVVERPERGELVLDPDGSFTYTPELGFIGEDRFTYAADDGVYEDVAVVTIVVE